VMMFLFGLLDLVKMSERKVVIVAVVKVISVNLPEVNVFRNEDINHACIEPSNRKSMLICTTSSISSIKCH
jgi:hypothetical protein